MDHDDILKPIINFSVLLQMYNLGIEKYISINVCHSCLADLKHYLYSSNSMDMKADKEGKVRVMGFTVYTSNPEDCIYAHQKYS